jgi:hypothetical protein
MTQADYEAFVLAKTRVRDMFKGWKNSLPALKADLDVVQAALKADLVKAEVEGAVTTDKVADSLVSQVAAIKGVVKALTDFDNAVV